MHSTINISDQPLPGVFRRFVAFWLDFILAMMATAPILGIVPTLIEWKRTGDFSWNFERDTPAPFDGWMAGIIVLTTFAGLAFYNAYPLLRRRPTPGSRIMRYQVVSDEGITLTFGKALLRPMLGFVSVCAAYLAPFVGRERSKGKFWVDLVFKTHAVKLC
jgi:uncharacterized RDD family membrane protein YckC